MKTMAIRLDEQRHAQLSAFAQLTGSSITELIRTAIDEHLEQRRNQPELLAKAEELLAEIDAEAATRRSAISALLGGDDGAAASEAATAKGRRGSRSGS